MKNTNGLILSDADFNKLSHLIKNIDSEVAELLDGELNRAAVVSSAELPQDVVCMNSKVKFTDLDTGKESFCTLVYPHEANIEENKISVLAPIGAALIGLRVGQVINWPISQNKEKHLKVIEVVNSNIKSNG